MSRSFSIKSLKMCADDDTNGFMDDYYDRVLGGKATETAYSDKEWDQQNQNPDFRKKRLQFFNHIGGVSQEVVEMLSEEEDEDAETK